MGRLFKSSLILVAMTLVAASLSFAKSHRVSLIYNVKVGTTAHLKAGTYNVHLLRTANAPELAFFNRNGKDVASVPVKIKAEAQANPNTEVDYNTLAKNEHDVTAIRFGGSSEEYVLNNPSPKVMTSKKGTAQATKTTS